MICITDLRRRGKNDFEVYSETRLEFIAKQSFLDRNGIVTGAEFDDGDFERIKAEAQLIFGIRTALTVLEYKDRSRKELFRKLLEKGIDQDVAQMAVDYTAAHGYQNDLRYATRLAERCVGVYGKRRAEELLYHRGIDRETARQALEAAFPEEDEETVDAVLAKSAAGKDLTNPAVHRKVYTKMIRLGFTHAQVEAAMRRKKEQEDGTT